ncbi:MAG: FAD-binding oxidoreductase, partial [Candidatus Bipolaricaulota bacterium]
CGAAIPTEPSIVVSMGRFNEIIELDEDNLMITCEAGVELGELFDRVDQTGNLFFPPHPGDEGAQVGGLVVENAGGARAVKYGVMRNFIQGIKAVLPTGEQVQWGGKVLKNNAGLDLMHLLIGSEGILGIVTEVTLRLYPKAKADATLLIPFGDRHQAMNTVPQILKSSQIPLALEYVEKQLIEESAEHLGREWPAKEGTAFLILILAGEDEDRVFSKAETITDICLENGAEEPLFAERRSEQENILEIRSNIYTALEQQTADILDVTVPPARVGDLMDSIDELASQYETTVPMYGHAADGNVHPHIMKEDGQSPAYLEDLKEDIYRAARDLGGVITGEHGIGETRVKNIPSIFNQSEIDLMRRVKSAFDPQGILNPGKAVG